MLMLCFEMAETGDGLSIDKGLQILPYTLPRALNLQTKFTSIQLKNEIYFILNEGSFKLKVIICLKLIEIRRF